ncbi:MAG: pyridoxal-dependent decarboxylase, exosortase A system-associated, partial [Thermoanaerobaculia bacterium]
MNDPRAHVEASINGFAVAEGCLRVGGIPLPRLAARVGGTPFFAYDRRLITERVALLRRHLPSSVHLSYAMKANPMPAVVQYLAGLVDGFDVASDGELKTVLDTPMPVERISFAGPGKTRAELMQAVAAGVTLNLESEAEMETVAAVGRELRLRPRTAVRVNPDFELRASGLRMAGGAKQFGVDAERVPAMLHRMQELELAFQGFHIYTGTQNLRAEAIGEAL